MRMTKDFLKKAVSMTRQMMNEKDEGRSLEENLAAALAMRLPEEDCEKAVADLLAGDRDFQEALRQIEENDDSVYSCGIDEALKDLTLAEQYHKLMTALNQFQDAMGKNLDVDMAGNLDIEESSEDEVTEDEVLELKNTLAQLEEALGVVFFENKETAQFTGRMEETGLESSGIDVEELDESKRYYMELAIYILYRQGEFVEIPCETSVRSIGTILAAAFAAAKTKILGIMGKIPWKQVLSTLGKIAGAALMLLGFAVLFNTGIYYLGFEVMYKISIIMLAVIVWFLLEEAEDWFESGKAEEFISDMVDTWNKISDGAFQWLGEKVEAVQKWLGIFAAWLKEKAEPAWNKITAKLPKNEERPYDKTNSAIHRTDEPAEEDNYAKA